MTDETQDKPIYRIGLELGQPQDALWISLATPNTFGHHAEMTLGQARAFRRDLDHAIETLDSLMGRG